MSDPYSKLRSGPSTPSDEICACTQHDEVYLAHKLGPNPLHCLRCNGEVPPEKLGFPPDLADTIASWNSAYGSVYRLWLASGQHESWALEQLLLASGPINADGLAICRKLSSITNAYFLWFYESDPPTACPLCGGLLTVLSGRARSSCESCKIVT